MELDRDLVKQFASVMKPVNTNFKDGKIYGTISKYEGDVPYVILDGSDLETPAEASVMGKIGDRVVVQIRNHKAYISDNFTAPPDGRVTDKYFYFDPNPNRGLIIGRIDPSTHTPTGNYVLITNDDYQICNENDEVLAVYSDDSVDLGANSDSAQIHFCNGKGTISYGNDILVLSGVDATGLKAVRNTDNKSSQVAVAANSGQLAAAMSILNANGSIAAQIGTEWDASLGTSGGYRVVLRSANAADGGILHNGYPVLTSRNLLMYGTVALTGKVYAKKSRTFTQRLTLPSGYRLAGLAEVSTNHSEACKITGFGVHPTVPSISASIFNDTKANRDYSVRVYFEWFAFNTSAVASGGDIVINLDDYTPDPDE